MIDTPAAVTVETPAAREERRRRLHRLDRCLDALETAMENDRRVVGPTEAAVLAQATGLIHEGTALTDAIEVVLLLQEAFMRPVSPPALLTTADQAACCASPSPRCSSTRAMSSRTR